MGGLYVGAGSNGLGVDGLYAGTLIVVRIGSIGAAGVGCGLYVLTKCGCSGCIGLYGLGAGVGTGAGAGTIGTVLWISKLPVVTVAVMPFTGLSVLIVIAGTFGCVIVVVVIVLVGGRGVGFAGTWIGTVFGKEGGI